MKSRHQRKKNENRDNFRCGLKFLSLIASNRECRFGCLEQLSIVPDCYCVLSFVICRLNILVAFLVWEVVANVQTARMLSNEATDLWKGK